MVEKLVSVKFHGGPVDGKEIWILNTEIKDFLIQVENTPDMMEIGYHSETRENLRHIYWSNGPLDFPIIETEIDLYYEGIRENDAPH